MSARSEHRLSFRDRCGVHRRLEYPPASTRDRYAAVFSRSRRGGDVSEPARGGRQISTLRPQNGATDRYRSSDLSFPRSSASTGKKAFVAGVADDQGFGWAISKCLAQAGCEVILGTWVPALNIFETSLRRGKFDELSLIHI